MGRATIIEERTEVPQKEEPTDDGVKLEDLAVEEEQQETPKQAEELPDKYKDKSIQDVVRMHQEAEKLLGKHSQEVGELRKAFDDFIRPQLETKAPQEDKIDDADFFADPQGAVNKAVENHPAVQEARKNAEQSKVATALQMLHQKHPDLENVLRDDKFNDWIKGSKVRSRLYQQADREYDTDAADELVSTWKELNQRAEQVSTADKQARREAVKNASTGTQRGSAETRGKPIYRRTDIIKLMREDPRRYAELEPEIRLAYAEKRVR